MPRSISAASGRARTSGRSGQVGVAITAPRSLDLLDRGLVAEAPHRLAHPLEPAARDRAGAGRPSARAPRRRRRRPRAAARRRRAAGSASTQQPEQRLVPARRELDRGRAPARPRRSSPAGPRPGRCGRCGARTPARAARPRPAARAASALRCGARPARGELVGGDRASLGAGEEERLAQLRIADRVEGVHLYRQASRR